LGRRDRMRGMKHLMFGKEREYWEEGKEMIRT
jgi:hypothetical protein